MSWQVEVRPEFQTIPNSGVLQVNVPKSAESESLQNGHVHSVVSKIKVQSKHSDSTVLLRTVCGAGEIPTADGGQQGPGRVTEEAFTPLGQITSVRHVFFLRAFPQ